ncbi:cupin domain-containing protein [Rhizobium leguminosarum]|uniref:cupin domain-containing protein n=1 Tax=Rhizobium leguminosarum TaxID=384 RepID=UPI003F9DD90C
MDIRSVRRVVTGHNEAGVAVIREDGPIAVERQFPGIDLHAGIFWSTADVPADNVTDVLGEKRDVGHTMKGGSVFRLSDVGPGFESPMHRTHSIDYAIVLEGAIQLELDSGEKVDVSAGDVVVQRGTNHLWRNTSSARCRIMFIMIKANPMDFGEGEVEIVEFPDIVAMTPDLAGA